MKKIVFLIFIIAGCGPVKHYQDQQLSLKGEWRFRADSLDRGIQERWFETDLSETVMLPGSMRDNGKGREVDLLTDWTGSLFDSSFFKEERYARYRQAGNFKIPFWLKPIKYYKGAAWYQKDFDLPEEWQGKKVELFLERCHWESSVYVNGQPAGSRNSLATPHEYDITGMLRPGRNNLSIRIDNRVIIPVGINSHSISDQTQSNWNGITGEILLKATPPVGIEDVQVYPDIHSGTAQVLVSLDNNTGGDFSGTIELEAESFNTSSRHRARKKVHKISINERQPVTEILYPMGKGVLFWDEFSPAMYSLDVRLRESGGVILSERTVSFGMREFTSRSTRFEINGRPLFLRGTLECCIFPLTGYPPMDEESWESILGQVRNFGLNHVRFHSWCPPEAAFRAADRLGIYFQVECSSWANQGSSVGDGSPVDEFIYHEGDRIMKYYGNHPSLCMMAYGNEPGGRNHPEYLGELLEYWKSKDDRRLYTAGAGWPLIRENQYHNGPQPRLQQWGAGLRSRLNAGPPDTRFDYAGIISSHDIPFVSHEIGQWCVYPDFNEIPEYTGTLKATNFEIFRESLEENHMGDQAGDFLMASGKLQALCYKAEIEAALRTPGFAGFQLLQLHDFPGQGTALVGVLNPFFQEKGYISAEAFRRFCSETVPLARMDKKVFLNTESFSADIEMAHFGESPMDSPEITGIITDPSGNTLHKQVFSVETLEIGNVIPAGTVRMDLQEIKAPVKLTLEVSVKDSGASNSWDFWVYPAGIDPDPGNVYITGRFDREAEDKLMEGGSVLLLTHGSIREEMGKQVAIGFSSIFWNTSWTGGQAPHTLGILCNPDHPVFDSFPTEYHSNWQWWDPVSHAEVMILDEFPAALKPLIQPIDTWFENRRLSLAFETSTGGGKLLVCSINMTDDLDGRPVSRQLLHSLLSYMNSDAFSPATEADPALIRGLLNH